MNLETSNFINEIYFSSTPCFDKNGIINLAGIMGSKQTSCSSNTLSVLVECAYFKPESIIGKAVKYNLFSDASHKFERGVDPLCHDEVLRRFIQIVGDHVEISNIGIYSNCCKKHINKNRLDPNSKRQRHQQPFTFNNKNS